MRTPDPIERVHAPTREAFERDFVHRGKPVIVTGVADRWPAFGKWSAQYLKATAGDAPVVVRYDAAADHFNYYTPQGRINKDMTFGEFLDHLTAEPPDKRFYLTEYGVRKISPQLEAEVDASRYVDDGYPVFFIGRDTFSPPHYHGNHEAFLCQVVGTKIVHMYPPEQTPCFYPYPWYSTLLNFARVDPRRPDLRRFPKFEKANGIRLELAPGEMLFIPIHWWHSVQAIDTGVSVTYFWPARRQEYRFPLPGLLIYAHHWLAPASVSARARKIARKVKWGVINRIKPKR